MSNVERFVADGCQRARRVLHPTVEVEVATRYAEQLAGATWRQRLQLRRQIRREVAARIEQLAPERALY